MSCRHSPPDASGSLASGTLTLRCLMENFKGQAWRAKNMTGPHFLASSGLSGTWLCTLLKVSMTRVNGQSIVGLCSFLARAVKVEQAYSGSLLSSQWAPGPCMTLSAGMHMFGPWILVQQLPSCRDSDKNFKLHAPQIRQAQCCCEIKIRFKALIT